jgi:hypothetical protein
MPRLQSSLKGKSPGTPIFLSFFLMDRFINYLSFLFFKKINSDYMLSIIIFFYQLPMTKEVGFKYYNPKTFSKLQ